MRRVFAFQDSHNRADIVSVKYAPFDLDAHKLSHGRWDTLIYTIANGANYGKRL